MNTVTEEELTKISVAPRVSKEVLDANIIFTNYFNAGEAAGLQGAVFHDSLYLLTICVITLANGFTVVGKSACASPENYNRQIGERIAYEDAERQVYALMGYSLKDHLAYRGQSFWNQPADPNPKEYPVRNHEDWLDGDARRNGVRK